MSRAGLGRTRAGWRALRAERVSRASMLALRMRTSRSERPGEERRRCWNSSWLVAGYRLGRPLVVQRGADHVGGQQVRGELDAGEVQAEHARERPRDEGLAQSGQVFEQDVAAGQDADQHKLQGPAAADDRALEL